MGVDVGGASFPTAMAPRDKIKQVFADSAEIGQYTYSAQLRN